ncbi:hypothetical protein [Hydrogenophaga sp.]|uniref:hypothetical protein n=1 Tax=Hydrogenophaga sp. TaxID=1904254 RepID=UPI0027284782|nr:hypothetical protein [Hydrogenophaga sp.]MDO9436752.1 hypothetical protein [Hydrogenophaga sp.]
MSLLEDDGLPFQGFPLNPAMCHPMLQRDAQALAAVMGIRNTAVDGVAHAKAALADAESALRGEKDRFELRQASAQRNASPLVSADFQAHKEALTELTQRRTTAMEFLKDEELHLNAIQKNLVDLHHAAEKRTKLSDDALDQELDAIDGVEGHSTFFLTVMGGAMGGVATSMVRKIVLNMSSAFLEAGLDRTPDMQFSVFLENDVQVHGLTSVARDLVCGFIVGGALFFVLKKTCRL